MPRTTVIRSGSAEAAAAALEGRYVYIGRPSQWGNPFRITRDVSRAKVIAAFRDYWHRPEQAALRAAALRELPGKVLGCYCHPSPCHGDVIAEYVNAHARD